VYFCMTFTMRAYGEICESKFFKMTSILLIMQIYTSNTTSKMWKDEGNADCRLYKEIRAMLFIYMWKDEENNRNNLRNTLFSHHLPWPTAKQQHNWSNVAWRKSDAATGFHSIQATGTVCIVHSSSCCSF